MVTVEDIDVKKEYAKTLNLGELNHNYVFNYKDGESFYREGFKTLTKVYQGGAIGPNNQ